MGCGSSNAVAAEASKNDADKPVDSQQMPKKVYRKCWLDVNKWLE